MKNLENIIKIAFKKVKDEAYRKMGEKCLDEETLTCFAEGLLGQEEKRTVEKHLAVCDKCCSKLIFYKMSLDEKEKISDIPETLMAKVKNSVKGKCNIPDVVEIIIALKDDFLQLIKSTGEVLSQPSFQPVPVYRGEKEKDAKRVFVTKMFDTVKIFIVVEREGKDRSRIKIDVKDSQSNDYIQNTRISLIKGDRELESYVADSGKVVFDEVELGKYKIELCMDERILGVVSIEIKK